MQELNKSKLRSLLEGKLPGKEAQFKMAPESRPSISHDKNCRNAAVLLMFFKEENMLKTVFMRRNEYDGPHSGQISLPGGMRERSDSDLSITALRETEEETGVISSQIEIVGKLSPLYIPISRFCVHPYLGWFEGSPQFKPDKTEVQYLFYPEVREFSDPKNCKYGTINHRTGTIETPYYSIQNEIVWGATAMIMSEFTSLIGY